MGFVDLADLAAKQAQRAAKQAFLCGTRHSVADTPGPVQSGNWPISPQAERFGRLLRLHEIKLTHST
jgi:hypothetical protein